MFIYIYWYLIIAQVNYFTSHYWLQTWNQYVSNYMQRYAIFRTRHSDTRPFIEDGAYMFDAIWTAALALNKTESQLSKRNLSLGSFTYKDEYGISDIIYEETLKLNFFGLSVSLNCT